MADVISELPQKCEAHRVRAGECTGIVQGAEKDHQRYGLWLSV
jgi:hypothetical protein